MGKRSGFSFGALNQKDIDFLVSGILFVGCALFLLLGLRSWSLLQGPKIHDKMSQSEKDALRTKWEPFAFTDWHDGQLGSSLIALAIVFYEATTWKQDKGKAVLIMAAAFAFYSVLGTFTIWTPIGLAIAGGCGFFFGIYRPSRVSHRDHVGTSTSVAPRFLFLLDAAIIVYAEFLRFISVEPLTSEENIVIPPPAVDVVMHRAIRATIALAFVFAIIGSDVHSYRTLLQVGCWIWFSCLCPCVGVYEGDKVWLLIPACAVLMGLHIFVYSTFPFNAEVVRFYRKWRGQLLSATDESFGSD